MHDMDRTRAEYETFEAFPGSFEAESEGIFGEAGGGQGGGVFSEQQEMEFASQLLEVTNEQELDHFLGNLIKSAGRAVGGFIRGPVGQALGGVLKSAAQQALPIAGSAIGNLLLPGVGGAIGGQLASAAGGLFGLELEGLSNEDREFEVSRRWVQFIAEAAKNAAQAAQQGVPPLQIARQALLAAARKFAPGLLQGGILGPMGRAPVPGQPGPQQPPQQEFGYAADGQGGSYGYGSAYGGGYSTSGNGYAGGSGTLPRTGRWYRRGRRIVLMV